MANNPRGIQQVNDESRLTRCWRPLLTGLFAIIVVALTVMAAALLATRDATLSTRPATPLAAATTPYAPAFTPTNTSTPQPTSTATPLPPDTATATRTPTATATRTPTATSTATSTATPTPSPTDTATVASTSTSTPTMTTTPPPTPTLPVCYQPPGWGDPSTWESYTVGDDDNLVALAIIYRTTYQDILGANCLYDPDDFVPGLRLLLPRLTRPLPSSMTTHNRLPTATYPPVRTWAAPTLVPGPGQMPTPSQPKATRLPPPAAIASAYLRPAANTTLPSIANTGLRPRPHAGTNVRPCSDFHCFPVA